MRFLFVLGFAAFAAALLGSAAAAGKDARAMEQTVRTPAVAGQFYTSDPAALRKEITGYLDAASPPAVAGDIVALVSPHAGYQYSGPVAAWGYRLLRGRTYDVVVVVSPSHTEYFPYSSVYPGTAYRTPLGDIPVDAALAKRIAAEGGLVREDMRGHEVRASARSEHALEVQLPFLQVALGGFTLVPIVMGDQSERTVEALGNALARALAGKKALIVASSDLSHFHPDREARRLDGAFQKRLAAFDPGALVGALAADESEACGGGPVAAAMIAAKALGATSCQILHYGNSGDVTGDGSSVVGYVSAVMTRPAKAAGAGTKGHASGGPASGGLAASPGPEKKQGESAELTREDKVFLLRLARNVIDAETAGAKFKAPAPLSPIMEEKRGAFVTLKKGGDLRGCIGYIEAIKPLMATIQEMAHAAAFNDWRFRPVRHDEVKDLEIEISVLSPITTVKDPEKIVVGKHGLIMTCGANRGLLLPQVPVEWGWDRREFLEQTCRKAGLDENAWKRKDTTIECFTADVFSERELGLVK